MLFFILIGISRWRASPLPGAARDDAQGGGRVGDAARHFIDGAVAANGHDNVNVLFLQLSWIAPQRDQHIGFQESHS